MSLKRSLTLFGVVVSMLSLAVSANATPVFTETFNSVPCGTGVTSLPNWTVGNADGVTNGNIDVLGTGTGCVSIVTPVDGNYLDLHGTTPGNLGNDNALITTTATFGAGSYVLTFFLGNNGALGANGLDGAGNSVQVTLGSFTQNIALASGMQPFSLQTLNITNTTPGAHLSFAAIGNKNSDSGPLLDSITLDVPSEVPEPASIALVLVGLCSIGLVERRIRRTR